MRPIRRILVAIKDPSARSNPAIDKGIQLASQFGATLELFHAIATHVYTSFGLEDAELLAFKTDRLKQNQSRLEVIAERARQSGIKVRAATEWSYPPHEAIVRQAQKVKADLIVAECHAGKRVAPLFLHLTDWELLRVSPVPVLLVKSRKLYDRPTLLAAVDPTHANAKPARLDDEILEAAVTFRRALRGSLHVAHAFFPIPDDVTPTELLDEKAAQTIEKRAQSKARLRLDATLKRAELRVSRSRRHLLNLHPVNSIPQLAHKIRSDIVVMGAISRTGIKRFLIGNTAERIIDDLACDVLVIKPKDFKPR
jgi:universal stress protein E